MRVRSASLTAGLALAALCAGPVLSAPDRIASGRRPVEQRAVRKVAPVERRSADRSTGARQVTVLTRQFGASMAVLRHLQPVAPAPLPPTPYSPAEAETAAASLRTLAAATALRLARLQDGAKQADALAAALTKGSLGATRQAAVPTGLDMRDVAGRAATQASHQRSLKDAITALAAAARAGPPAVDDGRSTQGLTSSPPVAGPLVQRYGQSTDSGPAAGVSYAPPPAAVVISPCRGRVDFAGPFRSYGQMVIVNCGRGYRYVLAGLERVDTAPGTAVGAGAPVGRMPDFTPGAVGRPTLYVQLRHGSDTVDPASRLAH